jgi:hypothetical protein
MYVQERLVYKKVWKFRLPHQKRDGGDDTVGWCDAEQQTTSMRDFWHFLPFLFLEYKFIGASPLCILIVR